VNSVQVRTVSPFERVRITALTLPVAAVLIQTADSAATGRTGSPGWLYDQGTLRHEEQSHP
jgi:hypothetical protein